MLANNYLLTYLENIVLEKDLIKEIEELKSRLLEVENEKAALLKVVSHDLRSPFNKLFALIGLFKMSDGALTNEQAKYLETMELVISDSLNKMRNLMDLRAIEGKGINILVETLDFGKLISKVVQENNSSALRKGIRLNYQEVSAIINSDKLSCQRILEQLISNAIKYSPTNSNVAVELHEDADDIIIQVVDGGYGISEKEQNELFKKFSILSTRTTGGESSTGIGLYIAQWSAKNIGGDLSYTNNEKSTFILRLPKNQS